MIPYLILNNALFQDFKRYFNHSNSNDSYFWQGNYINRKKAALAFYIIPKIHDF